MSHYLTPNTTSQGRHRDNWRPVDSPSLAEDPPPVHVVSGLCVGRHRRGEPAPRAVTSERGAGTVTGLAVAFWVTTFLLLGVGAFMRLAVEASAR